MDRIVRFAFRPWLLAPIFTLALLFAVALPAPAAYQPWGPSDGPPPPPPQGDLTAIDVPLDALAVLQSLGVAYQNEPRAGFYRAAASAAQLERLRAEGVAFAVVGQVAISTQGASTPEAGLASPDYCYGANYTDYAVPYNDWVYDPIWTNCAGATTVTSIDMHYVVNHIYANTELGAVIGSNEDINGSDWLYLTIETYNYCAPDSPPDGDASLQTSWNEWRYNINFFNGRPVNQRWDFVVKDFCSGYPYGTIDYWQIWVYYTAPTPTRTRTPTRTATPLPWRLEGKVFEGYTPNESTPIQGATVSLYCSNNAGALGSLLTSTTTDAAGWYGLSTSAICEYYNIVETDKPGYSSTGATSVGGVKINNNWIQYTGPLFRKTLTGNKFWDVRPTPTPTWTPTRTRTPPPGPTWTRTPTATPTRPSGTVTPTPTATRTSQTGPSIIIDKRLLTDNPHVISTTVRFEIDIYNNGSTTISPLSLSDSYPTSVLSYLGATPPSDDNIDDGLIFWSDLTTFFGPLAPGQMISVTVAFHAKAPTGLALFQNCATAGYTPPGSVPHVAMDCVPIDIIPRPPEVDIDKRLLSPPVVCVSDTVTFGVVFTNTGAVPLLAHTMAFTDTWNTNHLRMTYPWLAATGVLQFTLPFGPPFAPNARQYFTMSFHAEAPATPATNTIRMSGLGVNGVAAAEVSDSAEVAIYAAGPCEGNAIVNGGFEAAVEPPWIIGGVIPPQRVSDDKHSGGSSLRLGWPGSGPMAGNSYASQVVSIPSNIAQAQLSFWYRVRTSDVGAFDWLRVRIGCPTCPYFAYELPVVSGNWRHVTISLDDYRGKTVSIGFSLHNDTVLPTTVWLDDVTLCFATCGPPSGDNPPPGEPYCWKQRGFVDYAPAGVPDFDMTQDNWKQPGTSKWTHSAPVAAANSLWWFDSKFETGNRPPPTVSDNYALVTAAGAYDDHAPQNVAPLVHRLATLMATNSERPGTLPYDVYTGIRQYLLDKGLAISYTVAYRDQPTWDWVREEVKRSEDVILALGFWEYQSDGWKRLGGHYVTAAGVACFGDSIAISDPWFDNAEQGGPGFVSPPKPHQHPVQPPDVLHNDAKLVSHDIYAILQAQTPGGQWGLARYVEAFDAIENFFGVNVPHGFVSYQAERYRRGAIVAIVEKAIAVSPAPEAVVLRIEPQLTHVQVGEVFNVDLVAVGSGPTANVAAAYLNYDPALLQVVDGAGNPATSVIPGAGITPAVNTANNTLGRIDFLVSFPGGRVITSPLTLATLRFKALAATATYGTAVVFSGEPPRQTDVLSGAASILTGAADGFVAVRSRSALTFKVNMQGRPPHAANSWAVPLLLTLHNPGEIAPLASHVITTSTSGEITVHTWPTGTYDIRIKGLHTLRNLATSVPLTETSATIFLGTLLEGDANNDNIINAVDLSICSAALGTTSGGAGFDKRADFNNDGKVDAEDLALLLANFGSAGDIELEPAAPMDRLDARSWSAGAQARLNAGTVDLVIQPVSRTLSIGQFYAMTVTVQAGAQPVEAVEMYIALPAGMNVVGPDGMPVEIIEGSGVLPVEALNLVDNGAGTIAYAASFQGTPPSGTFTLATFRLRAGQPVNNMPVRFIQLPNRMTDVWFAEESVLRNLGASWVSVQGYSLHLPVILSLHTP